MMTMITAIIMIMIIITELITSEGNEKPNGISKFPFILAGFFFFFLFFFAMVLLYSISHLKTVLMKKKSGKNTTLELDHVRLRAFLPVIKIFNLSSATSAEEKLRGALRRSRLREKLIRVISTRLPSVGH